MSLGHGLHVFYQTVQPKALNQPASFCDLPVWVQSYIFHLYIVCISCIRYVLIHYINIEKNVSPIQIDSNLP